jgi:hypothetical protein
MQSENGNKNETNVAGPTLIAGAEISSINPGAIWPETNQVPADPNREAALKEIGELWKTPFNTFLPLAGVTNTTGQEEG